MGIFELNLTMVVVFLLLATIPSELYVFGHIFGRSKSYRKPLPSRCSSQLELSGTLSPISWLFHSGGGEKIHFQAQSACPPTNRMEIQNFDNQTTGKTRSHRPPTPLTWLAEMKITAQLTIATTKQMRLLGGGQHPAEFRIISYSLV